MIEVRTMSSPEVHKLRAIATMGSDVANDCRDLELLGVIEMVLDRLKDHCARCDLVTEVIEREIPNLAAHPSVIDPDGKLEETLNRVKAGIKAMYENYVACRESAKSDASLRPDDGVVEAFSAAIDSTAALHNAFNDLVWAIGEHDADLDDYHGPFTSFDDFMASIRG